MWRSIRFEADLKISSILCRELSNERALSLSIATRILSSLGYYVPPVTDYPIVLLSGVTGEKYPFHIVGRVWPPRTEQSGNLQDPYHGRFDLLATIDKLGAFPGSPLFMVCEVKREEALRSGKIPEKIENLTDAFGTGLHIIVLSGGCHSKIPTWEMTERTLKGWTGPSGPLSKRNVILANFALEESGMGSGICHVKVIWRYKRYTKDEAKILFYAISSVLARRFPGKKAIVPGHESLLKLDYFRREIGLSSHLQHASAQAIFNFILFLHHGTAVLESGRRELYLSDAKEIVQACRDLIDSLKSGVDMPITLPPDIRSRMSLVLSKMEELSGGVR